MPKHHWEDDEEWGEYHGREDGKHDVYQGSQDGEGSHSHAVYDENQDLEYFRDDDGTVVVDNSSNG